MPTARAVALLITFLSGCGATDVSPTAELTVPASRDLEAGVEWRLLVDRPNAGEGSLQLSFDPDAYVARLARAGVPEQPAVNFATEFVVFFDPTACPKLELAGVHLDSQRRLLYGNYVKPAGAGGCGDVATTELFVVAIRREVLGPGTWTVRVMSDYQLCADCGREDEEKTLTITP